MSELQKNITNEDLLKILCSRIGVDHPEIYKELFIILAEKIEQDSGAGVNVDFLNDKIFKTLYIDYNSGRKYLTIDLKNLSILDGGFKFTELEFPVSFNTLMKIKERFGHLNDLLVRNTNNILSISGWVKLDENECKIFNSRAKKMTEEKLLEIVKENKFFEE